MFGLVPALILLMPRLRARRAWLVSAAAMACCGVALNRFVMTVQTLALPTLSFDQFLSYWPSWQETGTFLAVVALRSAGLLLLVPLPATVSGGARIEIDGRAA